MPLQVQHPSPVLLEATSIVLLLCPGLPHGNGILGFQMAGVVDHGQGDIPVASDIGTTPSVLLGVAYSYMSGHVVHSVDDLGRNVIIAFNFIEQVPHRVVVNDDQGG